MDILIPHQAVSNPAQVIGNEINVSGVTSYLAEFHHAFNEATANTNVQAILIQGSIDGVTWRTITSHAITVTGTPADEVFAATEPAGETVIAVAATAGFTVGSLVYIRDTTVEEGEWRWITAVVTNTSITVDEGFQYAHALTTTSLFASAEMFGSVISVKPYNYIRAVYQNIGATAANTHIKGFGMVVA